MSALLSMRSRDVLLSDSDSTDFVVGHSAGWANAMKRARLVAPTEATVLLQGESGTGKEVIARLIHAMSPREKGPFVAINCAALPESLLESELFGYERGAFTGAQQTKPGQVEIAAGGVLFLDEVSEMSLAAQAKLLRFLQEREFQRLGGTRAVKTNVRIIAATNRVLQQAMERGSFRHDLYSRSGSRISSPPTLSRAAVTHRSTWSAIRPALSAAISTARHRSSTRRMDIDRRLIWPSTPCPVWTSSTWSGHSCIPGPD